MSTTSEDTPKRMGKTKKADRLDASRFQSPGMNYKGKLIGVEDVSGPRGDKMCQVAMAKVKAAVKTIGEHKLKIIVNISLDGVRIVEEKSENILYFHPVQRISFISRDPGDSRAFGYIYGREDGSHQFYGIKTEKVAENIVLNLRDLFQIVYEMKKQEKEELQDSVVHESHLSSSVKKGQSTKNGLDQLNFYSSSVAMLSSGHRASAKTDGSENPVLCGSSQSPDSRDSNYVGASRSGFQHGFEQHHPSEIKHSTLVSRHSQMTSRQYSSMTSSDCRRLHPSLVGPSAIVRQQSASDASVTRTSPLAKLRPLQSSVQASGWFPVAIPPPDDSRSSLGRRTIVPPPAGLDLSAAEGWAVFETSEQNSSTLAVTSHGKEGRTIAEAVQENVEETPDQTSGLAPASNQRSGETCAEVNGEADRCLASGEVEHDVVVKRSPFPKISSTASSSPQKVSESPVGVINCTFYSHVECSGVSPKSPSGVPKLASPESLSDEEDEEEEEEEEISADAVDFPSPDVPPPPLPLDMVIDYTLQPPAIPPRPAMFEFTLSRFNAELAESPIYSNLPLMESTAKSSFTLPRPRPLKSNGDHSVAGVRPIQTGYDLTMPRPRPVPNLTNIRPHDDQELNESRTFARPRFLRGNTLSVCQNEEFDSASQRSNARGSTDAPSADNNFSSDPFAICLLSKNVKPQTVVSLSSAEDGLVHTSISPIPRPRPRQRSFPSASRGSGASAASTSESPMKYTANASSPLRSSVDDQLNPKQLNRCRSESNRSEHSPNSLRHVGHPKAESLFSKTPKVLKKGSTGSNRSDVTPDPFAQVDPFSAESFSDDPFRSQPDPLSLESPASDPFSKEFPTKASLFYTRAVTVEMGDVFDDVSLSPYETDKKTSTESGAVKRSAHVSSSESAMEQKAVISLERATGDSAIVTAAEKPILSDQRSQERVKTLSEDGVRTCAGNGGVVWENSQTGDALKQVTVPLRQTAPIVEEQETCSCNFSRERALTENNIHLTKSEMEKFKANIPDSTFPTDASEGFSDSFDPISFSLESHPTGTLPPRDET